MLSLLALTASAYVLTPTAPAVSALRAASPAMAVATPTAGVKQTPHGGVLVDLFTSDKAAAVSSATVTIELNDR